MDFHILNHPCISGIKPTWSGWMIVLMCSWNPLVRILLSIFASIFIREIGLKVSLFVGSFCGLGIRVIVASQNELGRVLSVSILWNSLRSVGISSSLKIWQNFALKPCMALGLLFERLLAATFISLQVQLNCLPDLDLILLCNVYQEDHPFHLPVVWSTEF